MPGPRGISRTAPYFHDNSAEHHNEFFKRVPIVAPAGQPLPPAISTDGVHVDRPFTPGEVAPLLAYLRAL